MNPPNGHMYPDAWTWNPVGGRCYHECEYCYVQNLRKTYNALSEKYSGEPRIIESELKVNFRKVSPSEFVFVCNMTDLFAENVSDYIIHTVLRHCKHRDNIRFLFQSKNPARYQFFLKDMPKQVTLGTTIETNRDVSSKAPKANDRAFVMRSYRLRGYRTMVSIEPIHDFDYGEFWKMLVYIYPRYVSIGADSKGKNITEPSKEKIDELINVLSFAHIEVRVKKNLDRILNFKSEVKKDE